MDQIKKKRDDHVGIQNVAAKVKKVREIWPM